MKVQVERLHLRWSGREPGVDAAPAGRLWVTRLLAGADLHPPDMPPTALLVVARLEDPLPGRIARSRHDARPTAEWEQAVRSRLTDLWHRAARPVAGVVAAGAEAVRFADQAELIACLAVASLGSVSYSGAWWQGLVSPQTTLFALLRGEARLLPAVAAYLAGWGRLEPVLLALAPREALSLARAVAEEYHFSLSLDAVLLPQVDVAGAAPLASGGPGTAAVETAVSSVAATDRAVPGAPSSTRTPRSPAASSSVTKVPLPPWAPLLARRGLLLPRLPVATPATHLLLGLLLTLQAEPAALRSGRFLEALRTWWLAAAATGVATVRVAAEKQSSPAAPYTSPGAPRDATSTSHPSVQVQVQVQNGQAPPTHQQQAPPPAEPPDELPQVVAESPWPEPIQTRLGGLLYLVNVLLRLDLLDDDANPWERLEALGRALLPGELEDDPIWGVLDGLAGRDPDEPLHLPDGMEQQVRDWLRRALPGVEEPARYLLLVDGQLYVSATHLDLVMDLDAIRLEVRLAGLDVDPGWAPDFGRVIRFHFV